MRQEVEVELLLQVVQEDHQHQLALQEREEQVLLTQFQEVQ